MTILLRLLSSAGFAMGWHLSLIALQEYLLIEDLSDRLGRHKTTED
ncbi:MAG: hypothetical protein WA885_07025 [Phormidesmis sp.]